MPMISTPPLGREDLALQSNFGPRRGSLRGRAHAHFQAPLAHDRDGARHEFKFPTPEGGGISGSGCTRGADRSLGPPVQSRATEREPCPDPLGSGVLETLCGVSQRRSFSGADGSGPQRQTTTGCQRAGSASGAGPLRPLPPDDEDNREVCECLGCCRFSAPGPRRSSHR